MSTATPTGGSSYEIVDVTDWRTSHEEAMGTKAKMWLRAPTDKLWLFKRVRGDVERAEDWPEKCSETARQHWITRIRRLEPRTWEEILERVPRERASDLACKFAARVIAVNRGRLLDACSRFGS